MKGVRFIPANLENVPKDMDILLNELTSHTTFASFRKALLEKITEARVQRDILDKKYAIIKEDEESGNS